MDVAATVGRVEASTPRHINEGIRRATECSVIFHAERPEQIEQRLEELDDEWDIERTLEAQAAGAVLTGLVLSVVRGRRWLGLVGFSGYFLLQHAIKGWCPPVAVYRRLGVRTAGEIEIERVALKALRGDFGGVGESREPLAKAQAALRAAEGEMTGRSAGTRGMPRTAQQPSKGGRLESGESGKEEGQVSRGSRRRRESESLGRPGFADGV